MLQENEEMCMAEKFSDLMSIINDKNFDSLSVICVSFSCCCFFVPNLKYKIEIENVK